MTTWPCPAHRPLHSIWIGGFSLCQRSIHTTAIMTVSCLPQMVATLRYPLRAAQESQLETSQVSNQQGTGKDTQGHERRER